MKIKTLSFSLETNGHTDILDITPHVEAMLNESQFKEGSALVFVPGSTAGITTIEFESGLLEDYPEFMNKIIPADKVYHHDEAWHDGNGYAHLRSALQNTSFTVPFSGGKLLLGTWQQIILVDFDNRPRRRSVVVQLTGE